jgi:glycosyltransferase involved in cell wall biosynthesis
MRIAYFTEALPPMIDGVTRTLSHLVGTLRARRVEHRFYSGVDPANEWRDWVHRLPSVPFLPYEYYRMAIPFQRELERDLGRFEPTLIHAVNPTLLGNWAVGYADRHGLPVVSSFHTDFVAYLRHYGLASFETLAWRYLAWFHNRCDVTYVPTATVGQMLAEHGIHNTELWERGVDGGQFGPGHRDPALRARLSPNGEPVLLFVGRLVREKDLADLASAVHLLQARGRHFTLALVGAGPMERDLRALLPDAHFAGHQDGHALAHWYASADIFVFPSTTETFGNVVLEAFASGLPAVVVARGGVRDLVTPHVDGLVTRPNDPRAFADAIETLLRNVGFRARLRCGALATARRYDWDEVNGRLITSYARLQSRLTRVA